ncbi:MAG: hypothetical protein AAB377_00405 [Patescibacteria group bacterium]
MKNGDSKKFEIGKFYGSHAKIEGTSIFVVKIEEIKGREIIGTIFKSGKGIISSEKLGCDISKDDLISEPIEDFDEFAFSGLQSL